MKHINITTKYLTFDGQSMRVNIFFLKKNEEKDCYQSSISFNKSNNLFLIGEEEIRNDFLYHHIINNCDFDWALTTQCCVERCSTNLQKTEDRRWGGSLVLPDDVVALVYGYEVCDETKTIRSEWGLKPHFIDVSGTYELYMVADRWMDASKDEYRNSNIFVSANDIFQSIGNNHSNKEKDGVKPLAKFIIRILGLANDEFPAISGDNDLLHNWSIENPVFLKRIGTSLWEIEIEKENLSRVLNYKFLSYNALLGEVRWEEGENRVFDPEMIKDYTAVIVDLGEISFSHKNEKMAGTVIPLFSLRSEKSYGVGDFGDLKRIIQWLSDTGQKILQLLPINDTRISGGNEDSYPYNCASVFALHPQYIDINSMPLLNDEKKVKRYESQRKRLNLLDVVDYVKVNRLKGEYMRDLFQQQRDDIVVDEEYVSFKEQQQAWLTPYCAYRFLSKEYKTSTFDEWKGFEYYGNNTIDNLCENFSNWQDEREYTSYVQFVLYKQLKDARDYAHGLGVFLKGDIPIGVAPNSVEVWQYPNLFNRNAQAGAPPDFFSVDGQNWGFPTYNWENMSKTGYQWWKNRLMYMSLFFDAYRIDHVLGFFRIWEIPTNAISGLLGHFSPSLPFSANEIEKYNFPFDEKLHTTPFFTKDELLEIFKEDGLKTINLYFEKQENQLYCFKEKYSSQQLLANSFAKKRGEKSTELLKELLRLSTELLFIPDTKNDKLFHPRITAYSCARYKALSTESMAAYDALYENYYYKRHTQFWFEEAMRKLPPLIQSTRMLPCGEDLGMIPECVPWAMRNIQMLSLEIERMPKGVGENFENVKTYPYLSVATPGTHDMSTLRQWWCEMDEQREQYYNEVLMMSGTTPKKLSGNMAQRIIEKHLQSPSMLCLIAWQDWTAIDERLRRKNMNDEQINIPSNRGHIWNYRMHITIEQLLRERAFNNTIKAMIEKM